MNTGLAMEQDLGRATVTSTPVLIKDTEQKIRNGILLVSSGTDFPVDGFHVKRNTNGHCHRGILDEEECGRQDYNINDSDDSGSESELDYHSHSGSSDSDSENEGDDDEVQNKLNKVEDSFADKEKEIDFIRNHDPERNGSVPMALLLAKKYKSAPKPKSSGSGGPAEGPPEIPKSYQTFATAGIQAAKSFVTRQIEQTLKNMSIDPRIKLDSVIPPTESRIFCDRPIAGGFKAPIRSVLKSDEQFINHPLGFAPIGRYNQFRNPRLEKISNVKQLINLQLSGAGAEGDVLEPKSQNQDYKKFSRDDSIVSVSIFGSNKILDPSHFKMPDDPILLSKIELHSSNTIEDLAGMIRCEKSNFCTKKFNVFQEHAKLFSSMDNKASWNEFGNLTAGKLRPDFALIIDSIIYLKENSLGQGSDDSESHKRYFDFLRTPQSKLVFGPIDGENFEINSDYKTELKELKIRFGQPCIFIHHTNCEHIVVFNGIRAPSGSDLLNKFPRYTHLDKKSFQNIKCFNDKTNNARWVARTENEKSHLSLPMDFTFLCGHCLKIYLKDSGKEASGSGSSDLVVWPFFQLNDMNI